MKKKIGLMLLSIATFICATKAVNATEYSSSDWLTDGGVYGEAVANANDSNITKMKGNAVTHLGPYSKKSTEKLIDGISEDFYVMLDPSEFAHGELFETRLILNEESDPDSYVNEFGLMVQKTGDVFRVTSGIDSNFAVTVSNKGVYTMRHEAFVENGEAYGKITLLQGNNVLGSTTKFLLNDIQTADTQTIDDANIGSIVVKSVWYCNIQVSNGIDVYTELPTVNLTFVDPTGEDEDLVLDVYKYMYFTDDEVQMLVDEISEAAKTEGYTFDGFYADENLTAKYDFTSPFETDTKVYLKGTKVVAEEGTNGTVPTNVLPPKTSDINLFASIGMIVLSICGILFVFSKRFARSRSY